MTAACGAGGPHLTALNAESAFTLARHQPTNGFAARRRLRKSWISPDAQRAKQLLFESDFSDNAVEIFSLPGLQLKGEVTGFAEPPSSLCSDAKGNVWVMAQANLTELSHTGRVLQNLQQYAGLSMTCAVNPINGDLAVTILLGPSYAGTVLIYKHESGPGYARTISCPHLGRYYFTGYDEHGNLFVDGFDDSQDFELCRGRDTAKQLTPMRLKNVTIKFPGMLQWYEPDHYLALADQECGGSNTTCIYEISISGDTARAIGSTKLLNYEGAPVCDLVQGAITPGRGLNIVGGDDVDVCASGTATVDRWKYPSGGVPLKYNDDGDIIQQPLGAAISVKP